MAILGLISTESVSAQRWTHIRRRVFYQYPNGSAPLIGILSMMKEVVQSGTGQGAKALVGYETAKAIANVVLLSEIPTTYDKRAERQVNAGNLLLRGVPGVGKTFFGVILSAISDARFARIQGRADLPQLASALQLELDELLPLGESLQMLKFAVLEEGDIKLTDAGRAFVAPRPRARRFQ